MSKQVELHTNQGLIRIELDTEKAPISAENFLGYVRRGHYDLAVHVEPKDRLSAAFTELALAV